MYSLLKTSSLNSPRLLSQRKRFFSRARIISIVLGLFAVSLVGIGLDYLIWGTRFRYRTFHFATVSDHICDDASSIPNSLNGAEPASIPNLVHYVWLLENPEILSVSLKFFVSIYSAHLFWNPERIYLHTDATPEIIAQARQSGNPWTRRILAIPRVEINHVEAPRTTHKGVEIKWMQHKADFVRLDALRKFGGVYLDTDAIPLRDIADLRNTGFRNVIGQQLGLAMWANNYLNNGVMMAVPNSNLMTIYYHASHEFFDGGWDTASIRLLTDLGNRLASIPGEVLILQPQAFSPMSWQDEDVKRLFAPTLDASSTTSSTPPTSEQHEQTLRTDAIKSGACGDVLAWVKYRERHLRSGPGMRGGRDEVDFSSTYVLHAFDNPLGRVLEKGNKVDLKYVLARQSNYARAVFPAVWHAVLEGVIGAEEVR